MQNTTRCVRRNDSCATPRYHNDLLFRNTYSWWPEIDTKVMQLINGFHHKTHCDLCANNECVAFQNDRLQVGLIYK